MSLQSVVQKLIEKDQQRQQDERVDVFVKMASVLYDKAAAYTNVVVVAGYVAFFTVWGNMKELLSAREMLLSALSVTCSLVVFVLWEIVSMIIHAITNLGLMRVVNAPAQEFEEKLQAYQKAMERLHIRTIPVWYVILFLTVVPGLLGAAVLLRSFVRQVVCVF